MMSHGEAARLTASGTRARPTKQSRTVKKAEREPKFPARSKGDPAEEIAQAVVAVVEEEELSVEGLRLLEEAREELRVGERFFTSEEIKREFGL